MISPFELKRLHHLTFIQSSWTLEELMERERLVRLYYKSFNQLPSKVEEYLKYGSCDGKPVRQKLREELKEMTQPKGYKVKIK